MSAFTRRRLYGGERIVCAWCGKVREGTAERRPLVTVNQQGVVYCDDDCCDRHATVLRADEDAQGEYEADLGRGMFDG